MVSSHGKMMRGDTHQGIIIERKVLLQFSSTPVRIRTKAHRSQTAALMPGKALVAAAVVSVRTKRNKLFQLAPGFSTAALLPGNANVAIISLHLKKIVYGQEALLYVYGVRYPLYHFAVLQQ
jgi:hypothetical protein